MARDEVDEYYLTVAEVAEILRLNQQTVRNWIDQGSLPALRVGRRVRIKRSDLDRLLAEGYKGGSPGEGPISGPSAEDFWGGEPVGMAEVAGGAADQGADLEEEDDLGREDDDLEGEPVDGVDAAAADVGAVNGHGAAAAARSSDGSR